MEKKIEVEINGKKFRIAEHMLSDVQKFGATLTKRTVKDPPKELLKMPEPKQVILPPKLDIPEPKTIIVPDPEEYPGEEVKKTRKPRAKK